MEYYKGKNQAYAIVIEDFIPYNKAKMCIRDRDNTFNKRHIDSVLALKLVDVEAIKNAHFKVCVDAINSVAVSYTHLDVYKRQDIP